MWLLTYFIPGLPQYLRGQRLVGLIFGSSAVLMVLFMWWSNQHFLRLYGDLRQRVPRSVSRELWEAKDAHKHRGIAFGLGLILLSALDAAGGPKGRDKEPDAPAEAEAEKEAA